MGLEREAGAIPARTRRCECGRKPESATGELGSIDETPREGQASRVMHESEDLPHTIDEDPGGDGKSPG